MLYVTAQDLQDTLTRGIGGNSSPEEVLDVRRAIRQALRYVSSSHQWPYYHDYYHLLAQEPYATGTVTYTASTRVVTISGGTWPSWAGSGALILDTDHVRVEKRNSSTSLTVQAADAPADNYSGTFTLYKYQFELDHTLNLYKFGRPMVDGGSAMDYITPDLFETDGRRSHLTHGGRPRLFTVSRGPTIGRTTLSVWPYPSEAMRIRFGYIRHPRDIKTWIYETGVVTTGDSSQTVSGSDTAWTSDHVNCLLRTGRNRTDVPTSRDGRSPPVDEQLVSAVASGQSLTAASALSTTAQNVAYTLSDCIDVDINTMLDALIACARLELAKLRNTEPKVMQMIKDAYAEAIYYAKCTCSGDNTVSFAGRSGRGIVYPGIWDSYYTFGA